MVLRVQGARAEASEGGMGYSPQAEKRTPAWPCPQLGTEQLPGTGAAEPVCPMTDLYTRTSV